MGYTLGIPADGQSLGNSKPQVRGNFTTIFNDFAVNHIAFNQLNAGKHNYIQLPNRSLPPGLQSTDSTIYSQSIAGAGELILTRGNSGIEIQLTGPGEPKSMANGYTFLPGGILVQWGNTTASGSGSRNVVFIDDGNRNFPVACWHVFAELQSLPAIPDSSAIINKSTTGFTLRTNTGTTPSGIGYSWIAIGN